MDFKFDKEGEVEHAYKMGIPYFGSALMADQGSAHFRGFGNVVNIVRKSTDRQRIRILEVGSWAGNSLVAWDSAAQSNCDITCIDQWKPYFDGDSPPEQTINNAARTGKVKALFLHNTRVCGLTNHLTILEGTSAEHLPKLQGTEFDIVFIDGDHRYNFIVRDIRLAKPLVTIGGVLCGDDMQKKFSSVVDKDACRRANDAGMNFVVDKDNTGYHPGVAQAVHDVFGEIECIDRLWFRQKLIENW